MAGFFIQRPILAWVIAIVIMLIGGAATTTLPIEQYPTIAPPSVQITANRPDPPNKTSPSRGRARGRARNERGAP